MTDITLTLPKPHAAQQDIIKSANRFNVLDCGRRFGKTQLGINRLVTPENLSYPQSWLAPTYKILLEAWREIKIYLAPITADKSEQEKRLGFITGGSLECWSLDTEGATRSRKYKNMIIDEAARVKDLAEKWNSDLRSALADYKGSAWFMSTPRGRNDFWKFYNNGLDNTQTDWSSWQYSTYHNPFIDTKEIDDLKSSMPERIFRQEILAEFLSDSEGVFRGVQAATTATWQNEPITGHSYIMGVDWGKLNDFTVLTIIDENENALVHYDRFNQIDYAFQRKRLENLYVKFKPNVVIGESNSIGVPVIEQLQRDGIPIKPFTTTNASKSKIIEDLSLAFEKGFRIPDDDLVINELLAYEAERLSGGLMRYNAPSGMHDDIVMSLAIAYSGKGGSVGVMSLADYLKTR